MGTYPWTASAEVTDSKVLGLKPKIKKTLLQKLAFKLLLLLPLFSGRGAMIFNMIQTFLKGNNMIHVKMW